MVGTTAAFASVAGLVASLPVFDDWFRYQYIYHVPLAVLAAALEIVAVMALGIGLTLDSITHQEKMRFEKDLLATPRTPEKSDTRGKC